MVKFNILHLLIALGAASCAGVLVREAQGRLLRPSRLALAPLLAAGAALFLLALVAPGDRDPRLWTLGLALGALPGAVRGLLMPLEVDHRRALLRLPRGRDGMWAAAALAALSALAVVFSLAGEEAGAYEALAAAAATAAAGYLGGRALALFLRTAHAPQSTLGRAGRALRA